MIDPKEIAEIKSGLARDIANTGEDSLRGKQSRKISAYIEYLEANLNSKMNGEAASFQQGRACGLEDMARLILVEHERAKHERLD